ncbi:hypothetical protein [Paraburkholderia sp.]|uniref:hypothetical protein n=1 Tax=Paraburkholderia sp. TaxID=1926495 RepID=UPI00239B68AF|nr:hypothetical protein [Paraburkholderia sp.]MDE1179497.1 hypothetical protein [Paraburkholderia sp.]
MADTSNATSASSGSLTPYAFTLVVVHAFGDYSRGDPIADDATIATVMAGENAHHCIRVAK